jgi:hypothetical protein
MAAVYSILSDFCNLINIYRLLAALSSFLCWLLAALIAGSWLLSVVAPYCLLAAGCWLLAAGCWLLAAGCWLLAAGCCLLSAVCWLLAAAAAACWLLCALVLLLASTVHQVPPAC